MAPVFSMKSGGSLGVAFSARAPDSSSAFFWISAAAWNRLRQPDTSFDEMSIQPCSASALFWAGLRVSAALPPAAAAPGRVDRLHDGGARPPGFGLPPWCLAAAASSPTPAARDPSTTDRGTRLCSAGRERWACRGSRFCSPRSRRAFSSKALGPSFQRLRNSLAKAAHVESCGIVAASSTSCGCFSNEWTSANCDSNFEQNSADHNRSATGKAGSASVLSGVPPAGLTVRSGIPPAGLTVRSCMPPAGLIARCRPEHRRQPSRAGPARLRCNPLAAVPACSSARS